MRNLLFLITCLLFLCNCSRNSEKKIYHYPHYEHEQYGYVYDGVYKVKLRSRWGDTSEHYVNLEVVLLVKKKKKELLKMKYEIRKKSVRKAVRAVLSSCYFDTFTIPGARAKLKKVMKSRINTELNINCVEEVLFPEYSVR